MRRAITFDQPAVVERIGSRAPRISLFGVLKGSVRVKPGVDLVAPLFTDPMDAETNKGAAKLQPKA